jgi:hypothetical protein
MNEPQLLLIHDLVFVDKNPSGKQADGENSWILNNEENSIQMQFTLDGRKHLISPCIILRAANIDTLARQHACFNLHHPRLRLIHHPSKRHSNRSTER